MRIFSRRQNRSIGAGILFVCMTAAAPRAAEVVRLTIPGFFRSIPLHIVVPENTDPTLRLPLVLVLPPGRGNSEAVKGVLENYWEKEARKRNIIVVCPEMPAEKFARAAFRTVPTLLGYVFTHYPADRDRVVVAGNSNGGIGAFGCFVRCPDRFAGLLVFPGAPMKQVDVPRTLAGKSAYVLVGENDEEWVKKSEQLVAYLRKAGVNVEYEVLSGQGHALDISPDKLFDWIVGVTNR
jgi:predicted esterase